MKRSREARIDPTTIVKRNAIVTPDKRLDLRSKTLKAALGIMRPTRLPDRVYRRVSCRTLFQQKLRAGGLCTRRGPQAR